MQNQEKESGKFGYETVRVYLARVLHSSCVEYGGLEGDESRKEPVSKCLDSDDESRDCVDERLSLLLVLNFCCDQWGSCLEDHKFQAGF